MVNLAEKPHKAQHVLPYIVHFHYALLSGSVYRVYKDNALCGITCGEF